MLAVMERLTLWQYALPADLQIRPAILAVARAIERLRELEAHHVAQNRIKGRDESRSTTLRLTREALRALAACDRANDGEG